MRYGIAAVLIMMSGLLCADTDTITFGSGSSLIIDTGCTFVVGAGATLAITEGKIECNGTLEVAPSGSFLPAPGTFVDHGVERWYYTDNATITSDLNLSKATMSASLEEGGTLVIYGSGQKIIFAPGTAHQLSIGAGTRLVLDDFDLVHFSPEAIVFGEGAALELSDCTLSFDQDIGALTFPIYLSNRTTVNGGGNAMSVGEGGRFIVMNGQEAFFESIVFQDVAYDPIVCANAEGIVTLDSCTFSMAYDDGSDGEFFAKFTTGSWVIRETVTFTGAGNFSFSSAGSITIEANATLLVKGIAFLVRDGGVIEGSAEQLLSSCIVLDSATWFVGIEVLQARALKFISKGQSVLYGTSDNAFTFGTGSALYAARLHVEDGSLSVHDVTLNILDYVAA